MHIKTTNSVHNYCFFFNPKITKVEKWAEVCGHIFIRLAYKSRIFM